ncbi:MAG: acyl carrier protein [Polyangiaceae bacterium]|nr:acyl carrier protein [Polyangiaceae bacterium]MBK8941499.1 acyl carrier protein [Polyangiaceae bacterium]
MGSVVSDPSTKQRIRAFLETNFYIADKSLLVDDASLLDRGIVDSTGILEIVAFLESDFGIKVEDHELVPDNLDSIDRLVAFVATKRAT